MFELKKSDRTYYGLSGVGGKVSWYEKDPREEEFNPDTDKVDNLFGGTYTLTELATKAGYIKSDETWTIEISESGYLKSIKSNKTGEVLTGTTEEGSTTLYYYYYNTAVFDLPSAGSSGIFGYTMGGTLLLMAGTLILYKMKRKEVQES